MLGLLQTRFLPTQPETVVSEGVNTLKVRKMGRERAEATVYEASYLSLLTLRTRRTFSRPSNNHVASMSSPSYAWSALSLLFVVPIAVLKDEAEAFGMLWAVWKTWFVAFHHTLFLFGPIHGRYGVSLWKSFT